MKKKQCTADKVYYRMFIRNLCMAIGLILLILGFIGAILLVATLWSTYVGLSVVLTSVGLGMGILIAYVETNTEYKEFEIKLKRGKI